MTPAVAEHARHMALAADPVDRGGPRAARARASPSTRPRSPDVQAWAVASTSTATRRDPA